jgi:hypothetical protein
VRVTANVVAAEHAAIARINELPILFLRQDCTTASSPTLLDADRPIGGRKLAEAVPGNQDRFLQF